MNKSNADLIKPIDPLYGFAGGPIWPVGMINLSIDVAGVHVETMFHVVDASSNYNGILGRVWLEKLGAVTSPIHRCLKFYSPHKRYIVVHANESDSLACSIEGERLAKGQSSDGKVQKKRKGSEPSMQSTYEEGEPSTRAATKVDTA